MLHLYLLCRPDRTQVVAARITDQIRSRYRGAEVVWDVPFADAAAFAQRVETTMQRCNAVLVIIGPDWLRARSPRGLPWQDDPSDPVAVGLLAALRQKKFIVPLLVHGAPIPSAGDLAPQFAAFVLHQGIALREDPLFHTDLRKVYTQLNTQLTWRPASTLLLLTVIGVLVSIGVITAISIADKHYDLPSTGIHIVITLLAIILNVALGFSALIGAFVLAIQRKQMGWLAGLIALTIVGIPAIAGILILAGATGGIFVPDVIIVCELLSSPVLASFALFGKRREMV